MKDGLPWAFRQRRRQRADSFKRWLGCGLLEIKHCTNAHIRYDSIFNGDQNASLVRTVAKCPAIVESTLRA
jgi:hypothetical protein